jgi:hypothetical protein
VYSYYSTGIFLWVEKYQLQLTPMLEATLSATQVVEKGFIESLIVASHALTNKCKMEDGDSEKDSEKMAQFLSMSESDVIPSPTGVIEFSFDDVF